MNDTVSLTLIRGIPGTGKSTLASALRARYEELGVKLGHFEADQFFMKFGEYEFVASSLHAAHSWCFWETSKCLHNQTSALVSNTFTTWKEMDRYVNLVYERAATLNIITLSKEYGSVHGVPDEKMTQMRNRFIDHKTISEKIVELYKRSVIIDSHTTEGHPLLKVHLVK